MTSPSSTSSDPTTPETSASSTPTSPSASTGENYHERVHREFEGLISDAERQLRQLANAYPDEIRRTITGNLRTAKRNRKAAFLVTLCYLGVVAVCAFAASYFEAWLEIPFLIGLAAGGYMYANGLTYLHQLEAIVSQLEHLDAKYNR